MLYLSVQCRECGKFFAGAFFVSSGMQFYFYLVKIPIFLLWTTAVQSPQLSAVRGTIYFSSILLCSYLGGSSAKDPCRPTPGPTDMPHFFTCFRSSCVF